MTKKSPGSAKAQEILELDIPKDQTRHLINNDIPFRQLSEYAEEGKRMVKVRIKLPDDENARERIDRVRRLIESNMIL